MLLQEPQQECQHIDQRRKLSRAIEDSAKPFPLPVAQIIFLEEAIRIKELAELLAHTHL